MQPDHNGIRKKNARGRPRRARASAMNQSADDVGDSRTAATAPHAQKKDLTPSSELGEIVESEQASKNAVPTTTGPTGPPVNFIAFSENESHLAPEVPQSIPEVVDLNRLLSQPAPEVVYIAMVPYAPPSGQYPQPTGEDLAAASRLLAGATFKDHQFLNAMPPNTEQHTSLQQGSDEPQPTPVNASGALPSLVGDAAAPLDNVSVPADQSASAANEARAEPPTGTVDSAVLMTKESNLKSPKRDWLASHCKACNGRGHTEEDCPDSYLFYLKPHCIKGGPVQRAAKIDIPISCYKCASQQHLGDDCPLEPNPKKGVFSADFYNQFLSEAMPTPSADGTRLTQNDVQGLNIMPSVARRPNSRVVPQGNELRLDDAIEPRKMHPLPKKPPSKKLNVHLSQQQALSAPPATGLPMLGNHHVQYRNENQPRRAPRPSPNVSKSRRGGDSWRPGDDRR